MTDDAVKPPEPREPATPREHVPGWRRLLLLAVRRRRGWATAYTGRQLRLADEDLLCSGDLAGHVDAAADAAERVPTRRLADRHRDLRWELYTAVRAAERRMARSGAYELRDRGLIGDPVIEQAVAYVADQVRPELDRVDADLAGPTQQGRR